MMFLSRGVDDGMEWRVGDSRLFPLDIYKVDSGTPEDSFPYYLDITGRPSSTILHNNQTLLVSLTLIPNLVFSTLWYNLW